MPKKEEMLFVVETDENESISDLTLEEAISIIRNNLISGSRSSRGVITVGPQDD